MSACLLLLVYTTTGTVNAIGGDRNFHMGEFGGRQSPSGVEGSGDEVPEKLKQFADIVYTFLFLDCGNDQNLKNSHNSAPDS